MHTSYLRRVEAGPQSVCHASIVNSWNGSKIEGRELLTAFCLLSFIIEKLCSKLCVPLACKGIKSNLRRN